MLIHKALRNSCLTGHAVTCDTVEYTVNDIQKTTDSLRNMAFNGRPPSLFQQYACSRILHASPQEFEAFHQSINALWTVTQLPYDTLRLAGLYVGPLLSLFDLCLERQEERQPERMSHKQEVFNRFIRLVNKHVQEAHTLDYYADRICLTPRYLGTIVKEISGETAKNWIDRALITKAKVMLRHTDQQIIQIADHLGFPNCSFFCKFFKQKTGMTPQSYRDEG